MVAATVIGHGELRKWVMLRTSVLMRLTSNVEHVHRHLLALLSDRVCHLNRNAHFSISRTEFERAEKAGVLVSMGVGLTEAKLSCEGAVTCLQNAIMTSSF